MPDQKTTAENILDALTQIGGIVQIASPAIGIAIPIISGVIALITKKINSAGDVEYTVVLKLGQDELDKTIAVSTADISTINAELAKIQKPPLVGS